MSESNAVEMELKCLRENAVECCWQGESSSGCS